MSKELQTMVQPRQIKKIKMDSRIIDHETVRSVNVYMVAYLMIFAISLVLISFDNHDLITSFTAVTATINNIGPGLDLVGPTSNFGLFTMQSKIVLIFDMLAGRLGIPVNVMYVRELYDFELAVFIEFQDGFLCVAWLQASEHK